MSGIPWSVSARTTWLPGARSSTYRTGYTHAVQKKDSAPTTDAGRRNERGKCIVALRFESTPTDESSHCVLVSTTTPRPHSLQAFTPLFPPARNERRAPVRPLAPVPFAPHHWNPTPQHEIPARAIHDVFVIKVVPDAGLSEVGIRPPPAPMTHTLRTMRILAHVALAATTLWLATPAAAQSSATQSGAMQKAYIHDPVLNMDAYVVSYPAKWHFEGTLSQGGACESAPVQVFRVSSPDGLIVVERMPNFDWTWGTAPDMTGGNNSGCLPLHDRMAAKDFLKYLSAILKVEYVGDEPIDPTVLANFNKGVDQSNAYWQQKYQTAGMTPPTTTGELASANVRFTNGTVKMQGRLIANVMCTSNHVPNVGNKNWIKSSCDASVRYVTAPETQFKSVFPGTDKIGAEVIP